VNPRAKYLDQMSFRLKVIVSKHIDTYTTEQLIYQARKTVANKDLFQSSGDGAV